MFNILFFNTWTEWNSEIMNMQDEYNNSIQKILGNSLSDKKDRLFRVKLFYHLDSEIKIKIINGKKTDLNSTRVLINDIGPSGLKFISDLTFPVNPAVIFSFRTLVLDETINVFGHIVWMQESLSGLYEYGIKFEHNDSKEQYLIKLFNTLQISIRKSPLVSGCSFYTGDLTKYFLDFNKEKVENADLEETKNLIFKYEEETLNNYRKLLDIYRKYKGNEEIEGNISNFITRVKQVIDKFDL